MHRRPPKLVVLLAVAASLVLFDAPERLRAAEPFFAHKTITISIGYTGGGSYSTAGS